jgi:hypothetical protein
MMYLKFMLAIFGLASNYGVAWPEGNSAEYWRNAAVQYAEVLKVEAPEHGMDIIHLKPLAVLTGTCDAAYQEEITANAWTGLVVSKIAKPPVKGAKVLVVGSFNWTDNGKRYLFIPNGDATFFPEIDRPNWPHPIKDRPCLFEVTGFDDPKVTETIENLRKLRGKQREEAEKAEAEKKVSGRQ